MTLLNAILQNDTVKVLVLDNQKSVGNWIKEPNTIIAIMAIIVSLLGLWISVRYNRKTLEHTIKHSKLSVEPMLFFKAFNSAGNFTVEYILRNSGLGTGKIKSFNIFHNTEKYDTFEFILKKGIIIKKDEFHFATFGNETFISANSEIPLLKYKAITKEEYTHLYTILDDTNIVIEYESMYGDKKVTNMR